MSQRLPTIRTANMDSADWEYTLAGHLIGTNWVLPETGVDTIARAQQTYEREQGVKMEYPEIVFKQSGKRFSVSGFLRRIDSNDIGDIKPSDGDLIAQQIKTYHERNGWRNTHNTDE